MKSLLDWLDHRTGYRKLLKGALYEHVPGGARWRYIWGSTLTFAIVVQFITGAFLWMNYSPSAQTAWESVYYINHVARLSRDQGRHRTGFHGLWIGRVAQRIPAQPRARPLLREEE
jgi:hypothetical protein